MFKKIFDWLDRHGQTPKGRLVNQLLPVVTCLLMFLGFMGLSLIFIDGLINPVSAEKVKILLRPFDVTVGFLLYFVTAIDYALIVGRMQVINTGSKPRFVMNVFTCLGCFFGVTLVLFLWGFAKEVPFLIIPILFFAGSVMVKLAYEGRDYFSSSHQIPGALRIVTGKILNGLYFFTRFLTGWIPKLGSPDLVRMSLTRLAKWSFFLPFIIGLDDLVGYMGAMTIYNVFSLLFGIYLADVVIDILIFVSPRTTKRIVESPYLSFLAAYAFMYLAYKSFSEALILISHEYGFNFVQATILAMISMVFGAGIYYLRHVSLPS